ncbi:MAG TPA: PRC-barrel domain-containing protein [Thermoleophilaceae bacterium]|nr:PRC-barrel domain-containing protein [Thermoleophilaceae bacterium]
MSDLQEALGWTGYRVDDVYGARVGTVVDVYVDNTDDEPCWLLVKMGRFSDAHVLVPMQDAVAGTGHVWVPFEKDLVRRSAHVSPGMPVTKEYESELCAHYGVISSRGVVVAEMPDGALTAASVNGPPPVENPGFYGSAS